MPTKSLPLFPGIARELKALGPRIRDARLRRRLSAATVSVRAGISRPTLHKIEHGDPAVTLGNYAQVLRVLGLEADLGAVARDDILGRRLQDEALPQRRRAPRSRKPMTTGSGEEALPGAGSIGKRNGET